MDKTISIGDSILVFFYDGTFFSGNVIEIELDNTGNVIEISVINAIGQEMVLDTSIAAKIEVML